MHELRLHGEPFHVETGMPLKVWKCHPVSETLLNALQWCQVVMYSALFSDPLVSWLCLIVALDCHHLSA
jgi:hypothetical protein